MAATALVGSAFLSATVEDLLLRLASSDFIDYITSSKLNILKLTIFETSLLTLNSVLPDAERKQFFNPAVKKWMDDLYDVISDADDLIDEIGYDLMRCKVENSQPKHDLSFNSRLYLMNIMLELFVHRIRFIGLESVSGRVSCRMRLSSSSVLNESFIVGREDDKEKLMNMLLSDTGTNLDVVAVLGVGGVGKTTLAELVYNDKEVNEHFDLKMWICVSENFDIVRVIKTLLASEYSSTYKGNDLDYLRLELKQKLKCRRFLFVLDDLWNVGYNDWLELVAPLVNGKLGSRVIITTRQEKVAEVVHTFPIHKLEPLSYEDCWSLLSKHAYGSKVYGGSEYPDLEAIGKKIARKCLGLPLAAKTLGGLLSSTVDLKDWISILISNIWKIPDNNILPSLLLSYQRLPSYLKRCFAYCSVFPKGYSFDRKQLILLWMAEGFLEHFQGEKVPEEVGDDYFVELLSRSFIQQLNDDSDRKKFVLHDLLYDLAEVVSGKSCCKLECGAIISKKVQHLSYIQDEYDTFKKFEIFYDFKSLRSVLPICICQGSSYLSRKVVDDLLPTLRRLRVLSLSHHKNFTVLPDSIYNLFHLRYLDLSYTDIKSLPESICDLYYLQTLNLSSCFLLNELPVDIGKLINLRHLVITDSRIKKMPMQIVRLENLQTLSAFIVGKQDVGLSVRELGKFPNIRGKLYIGNLCNVINVSEACDANLKNKELIDELELVWKEEERTHEELDLFWNEEEERTHDSHTETVVLDGLQPSINLKKLIIGIYHGTSFPSWLGDSSFSNMVYLCICYCDYCVSLPSIGQLPSLKDLSIEGMSILETIGPEFYGMSGEGFNSSFQPFPSLEHLKFSYMSNWKEWSSFRGNKFPFPRLKTLKLDDCPKLKGHLPSHLPSIEEITIIRCDGMLATPSTLHWLSSVKSLEVHSGKATVWSLFESNSPESTEWSLLESNSAVSTEWSLFESNSACLLQRVIIRNFSRMMLSLPKMLTSSTSLQHLELYSIPSLLSFPEDGLPTSLQSLSISNCKKLAFLPPETWSKYTSLVSLDLVQSCDALTSFSLNGFPVLQSLDISDCENLQCFFISEIYSHCPSTLQSLNVSNSDAYISHPQRMNTPNCNALISLPQRMDTLVALESLRLILPSLPCYEGASLPPNLRSIFFVSWRTKMFATGWGLQNLSALSDLDIRGDGIVNTMLKEQLLPVSLVSLSIHDFTKRKSLPGNGLQHLSSLETLRFNNCTKLGSLPENMFPSYLKSLEFCYCPKLKSLPDRLPSSLEILELDYCQRLGSLPKDGLPSLKRLIISNCRLLKAKYENQRGEHWSNIAHIPVIKIDYKLTI